MNTHQFNRATASSYQKLTLIVLFLFVGLYSSIAQQCQAELTVEKNRKYKTVSEEGALFTLELSNKSNSTSTYTISSELLEQACGNASIKSNKPNTQVDVSVLSSNRSVLQDNTISVGPNATKKFKVLVNSAQNSSMEAWGCVQITATSKNCSSGTSTVLSAWVSENVE